MIGGNARTTLLVNVSPSSLHAEETLSTLRFGERAQVQIVSSLVLMILLLMQLIKNAPTVNQQLSYAEMKNMLAVAQALATRQAQTIKELQQEIRIMQQSSLRFDSMLQQDRPAGNTALLEGGESRVSAQHAHSRALSFSPSGKADDPLLSTPASTLSPHASPSLAVQLSLSSDCTPPTTDLEVAFAR